MRSLGTFFPRNACASSRHHSRARTCKLETGPAIRSTDQDGYVTSSEVTGIAVVGEHSLAEMGAEKTGAAGDERSFGHGFGEPRTSLKVCE